MELMNLIPNQDIAIYANDVESYFIQLKHHPEVMGAFSLTISTIHFLQRGLKFLI